MSAEATIRRGVRNARYTTVPNHVFEDDRLSMEARWLLGYLLSKPDNWTVVIGDIVKRGKCGRDKARKMIAELVEVGYAEREQTRDDGKFSASVLVIYDEPLQVIAVADQGVAESVAFLPQTDLPATVKPSPVLPSPVNPTLVKTDYLVTTDSLTRGERIAGDLESAPVADAAEKGQGRGSRERASRQFNVWYKVWPKPGSPDFARNAWFALSDDERAECIEKTPAYLAWAKPDDLTAPAVYLKGRAWNDLPENFSIEQVPARGIVKPEGWVSSYSPRHAAKYFQLLLAGPDTPSRAPENGMWFAGKLRDAWPSMANFWQHSDLRGGLVLPVEYAALAENMEFVNADSLTMGQWRQLFREKGWPELKLMASGAYLPKGGPQGLDQFESAARDLLAKGANYDAAE